MESKNFKPGNADRFTQLVMEVKAKKLQRREVPGVVNMTKVGVEQINEVMGDVQSRG